MKSQGKLGYCITVFGEVDGREYKHSTEFQGYDFEPQQCPQTGNRWLSFEYPINDFVNKIQKIKIEINLPEK